MATTAVPVCAAIGLALLDHLGSHHAGVDALCCLTMAGRPVVVGASGDSIHTWTLPGDAASVADVDR